MNNGIEGDVQSRMDAFRGNPQALAQRYAQDQQLIDLLALQKLKSEKDAAARQMQMQAGQGQMPTIAQQREQELMGMAKQEVAQRVGAVGQQQAQQQQKNLQQAMQGGIAQAPAPNMMPPQAMASGGIVAFADGGDTGTKSIEQLRKEYDDARASGDFQEASRLFKVIKARSEMAPRTVTVPVAEMGIPQVAPPAAQAAPAQVPPGIPPAQTAPAQAQGIAQAAPAQAASSPAAPVGAFQGDPQQIEAQLAAIKDPTERAAATAAFQRQMAAGNLAPQAQGQGAQQPAQPDDLQALRGALNKGFMGDLQASPEDRAAAAEAEHDKRYGALYKQQNELSQQGIAQLQQRMAQQPKKDPISEFLRGMSSQRTLGMALGAGGAGITAAQKANFEQQAELEDQLQKLRETGLSAQVTQETGKYGAGKEAAKAIRDAREKALQYGATYAVGIENAKSREAIAELQNAVRAANTQTQDFDRKKKLAEDAYDKDPEVETLQKQLTSIGAQMDPAKSKTMIDRMREIQKEKYRLYGVQVPETSAPAAAAPSANRPPLTSFKR